VIFINKLYYAESYFDIEYKLSAKKAAKEKSGRKKRK